MDINSESQPQVFRAVFVFNSESCSAEQIRSTPNLPGEAALATTPACENKGETFRSEGSSELRRAAQRMGVWLKGDAL